MYKSLYAFSSDSTFLFYFLQAKQYSANLRLKLGIFSAEINSLTVLSFCIKPNLCITMCAKSHN